MVYELYVTDLFSAGKQSEASDQLDGEWAHDRTLHPDPVDGKAFARIHIPGFGVDYNFTIQEGTDETALEVGPGHYKGTALPGEPGNFAVAGHRVGKGAPFNDLDNLSSCDQIVIETSTDFYIYKVLPYDDEVDDWAAGKGADPKCKGVSTLRDPNAKEGGAYSETFGRKVVLPSQGTAVNPVPYKDADALPKAEQAALLTLTTCHPQFSARERLIITSVLTQQVRRTRSRTTASCFRRSGRPDVRLDLAAPAGPAVPAGRRGGRAGRRHRRAADVRGVPVGGAEAAVQQRHHAVSLGVANALMLAGALW
jgi:sortase (surface protein transpeptidase)